MNRTNLCFGCCFSSLVSRKPDASQSLRFFRGYVRLPPSSNNLRREVDPRHLCGDTSESDFSNSDEEEEETEVETRNDPVGESESPAEKTGVQSKKDAPAVQGPLVSDPNRVEDWPTADDEDLLRTDCL